MKYSDVSKDTQIALLACALGGCFEVLARSSDDKGTELMEAALQRVGLTVDEFRVIVTNVDEHTAKELIAVMDKAQAEDEARMQNAAVDYEFRNVGTEWIKQGLLDRELLTIEQADSMNRMELLAAVIEHRKTLPDLLD